MTDKELIEQYLEDQKIIDKADKYIANIESKIALTFMIFSIAFLFLACEVIQWLAWQDKKEMVVSGVFGIILGLLITGTIGALVIEKLTCLDKLYAEKLGTLITDTTITRGHKYNTRKYGNHILTCSWKLKKKVGTKGVNVESLETVTTDDKYFLKVDKMSYDISENAYNTLYDTTLYKVENDRQIIILDADKFKDLG